MKSSEALFLACDEIESLLVEAGLVNSLLLNPEQLKTEKKPIFWRMQVYSTDGSNKETYITYYVSSVPPTTFGDNKCTGRTINATISFFSRGRDIKTLIENVENVFLNNDWTFELFEAGYDTSNKLTTYSFSVQALITDEN